MKYSVSWLNELAGTTLTPKEMAELFTRHSFEVDELEEGSHIPDGVVVGKILEVSPHPGADKLQLTKVTIDPEEKEVLDIVCGAKNIAMGDVVPVATIGTMLPNGLTIKESLIRGEKSCGMLCAEDELGLGSDHSGILHLSQDALLGTPVSGALPKRDAMIELSILSARGHDALSHLGIAREVMAMTRSLTDDQRPTTNDISSKTLAKISKVNQEENIQITIEAKEKCSRYIGVYLKNIKNGASPEWMQERLKTCGMRPVSSVVDITNYVMLEVGQPLHAFDAKSITNDQQPTTNDKGESKFSAKGGQATSNFQIHVRNAREGEKMTLLDESEIMLAEEDVVIANDVEVLALAGVMGGLSSGTSEETTEVFLESACFSAMSIRKSRVRHKMDTESSYRFERDIDPNMAQTGALRAVELLEELCGAEVVSSVDIYPEPVLPWTIDLDTQYVEKLLGIAIPEEKIVSILESLGMTVDIRPTTNDQRPTTENGNLNPTSNFQLQDSDVSESSSCNLSPVTCNLSIVVPTQRRDLHTQEDVIEEIGRLYGYDHIEPKAPMVSLAGPIPNAMRTFERALKDVLVSAGSDEILSYSFYRRALAQSFDLDEKKHFELQNPMNPDQELFRMSVLPNALEKVRENLRYFDAVSIFEVGNVYEKGDDGSVLGKKSLVVLEAGETAYSTLKGRIETALSALHIEGVDYVPAQSVPAYFHKSRTAEVICRGKRIAIIGELSPFILRSMKIKKRTACCMADMDVLLSVVSQNILYTPISKYPFVWRDMSLSVPHTVTSAQVTKALKKSIGKQLQASEIFDVYEKEGERSLAYHLAFGDIERTLTKDEVETMFQKGLTGVGELNVKLKMQN